MPLLVAPEKADDVAIRTLLRVKARKAGLYDAAVAQRDWAPELHQVAPDGNWFLWLLLGGRGTGKTDGGAAYVNAHVAGPPCISGYPGGHRVAIIAPTLGDAVESCVTGPSGLKAHNPEVRLTGKGGTHVRWPNRVEAKLFGAFTPEDVERLRAGGNRCLVWAEELAAWAKLTEVWNHMMFGLRLGPRPHVIATTTPKPKPKLRELLKGAVWTVREGLPIDEPDLAGRLAKARVVVTHGTTDDNPHLSPEWRENIQREYAGTRLGRQELQGELIDDVEGALWTQALLEANRVKLDGLNGQREAAMQEIVDRMVRIVVAVDPSGGDEAGNAEVGIVAAGKDAQGNGFVLADESGRYSPKEWASRAAGLYHRLKADRIVAEANFGGAMVEYTLKSVDPTVPVKMVNASRGKRARAEPVASLDEQGRVHHVGLFAKMEDQMTTWVPDSGDPSPDRMDARVWAITDLMLGGSAVMVY